MNANDQHLEALADSLYERHGKPLEKDHWKYVVISEAGEVLVGEDDYAILEEAGAFPWGHLSLQSRPTGGRQALTTRSVRQAA